MSGAAARPADLARRGGGPGGLEDAKLRLVYINQHRELMLGGLALAAAAARLLGAPVPNAALLLLAAWAGLAVAFVPAVRRCATRKRLAQAQVLYFGLELTLITLLAYFTGGAAWLGVMWYGVTVLYANFALPRRQGLWVTLACGLAFALLVLAETRGWIALHLLPGMSPASPGLATATVAVGLAGNAVIAYTGFNFARTYIAQAAALRAANLQLKTAGAELRIHQDRLGELVTQRTADLTRAYEELRLANLELHRLNETKTHFLANVSHELRTPLTSIRSFSELLLTTPELEPATRTEFLEVVLNESDRLTRLINDVLDLTRIEAGELKLRLRAVALAPLVEQSLELFQLQAEQQCIDLRAEVPDNLPDIWGDPDRMAQVFANLVSNALKFTASGWVRVSARALPECIEAVVEDTGPGLPAAAHERIFDKFHQHGDPLTGKPEGTGLGLAICREIMQQHGGRIWVESLPGHGCRFICQFPALQPAARRVVEN